MFRNALVVGESKALSALRVTLLRRFVAKDLENIGSLCIVVGKQTSELSPPLSDKPPLGYLLTSVEILLASRTVDSSQLPLDSYQNRTVLGTIPHLTVLPSVVQND